MTLFPYTTLFRSILKEQIKDYDYGTRREDQRDVIDDSGLFDSVIYLEGSVLHKVVAEDFIEGWKSHGTVHRQSKDKFDFINKEIRKAVEAKGEKEIFIPYTTRIWLAQVK